MIEEIVGFEGEKPMVLSTKGSVGASGNNWFEEIKLVQALLNNVPPEKGGPQRKLAVDASPGPLTIAAIKRFQQANGCVVDGRIDARGQTIRELIAAQVASGKALPSFAGLREATSEDLAPGRSLSALQRPLPSATPQGLAVRSGGTSSGFAIRGNSGFGAPFTPAGWTIDNSVASFDVTLNDKGGYVARMELFRDAEPTDRFKLTMAGAFKSFSPKGGLPFGFDVALPSFAATRGTLIRGLTGIAPISRESFFGVCSFAFAGGNTVLAGASAILLQFNWAPAPPGAFLAATAMIGFQMGTPGVAAGAGLALAVPV